MRKGKIGSIIWIAIIALIMNGGLMERLFSRASTQVEYDYNMNTTAYHTDIQIGEDGSYTVRERIDVDFLTDRHGIYRYIPIAGTSTFRNEAGKVERIPYSAEVTNVKANVPVEVSKENGNAVLKMGSASSYEYGPTSYEISYSFIPSFQEEGYQNVYYNVFPLQWQNDIPAGSSFTVTFPKAFDADELKYYYGEYSAETDATSILDLQVDGNTVRATLLDSLNFGQSMTVFGIMGDGYFTSSHLVRNINIPIIIMALLILAVVVILFFCFGRDEEMIPSIQFQPPDNLDSAAVGYIIDGSVENRDVISLIIYWADKGYLTIEDLGDGKMVFHKKCFLPPDAAAYEKTMFRELFARGEHVSLNSLKYNFAPTISAVKAQIKMEFTGKKSLYTGASRSARAASIVLCGLPFALFMLWSGKLSYNGTVRNVMQVALVILLYVGVSVFCHGVDSWHGKSAAGRKALVSAGLGVSLVAVAFYTGSYITRVLSGQIFNFIPGLAAVAAVTCVMVVLTGFMKKRTHQCVEWMGRLVGLRDFIETAELDRLKILAKENPDWFYHIIPYAYVFGLSDVFAKKLQGLSLEPPVWYETGGGYVPGYFDYYMFNRMMMGNMNHISRTLTIPEPPQVSSSDSNFGSGGGFGGGFGGGGGGGFSGGGFGGGGGGSW